MRGLLPYDFNQNSLGAAPVELSIKDLLPWTEIELPLRYRHHDFPAHDLSLVMGISVVLAGSVVVVTVGTRVKGR